ncbi:MAG: peptide ABC transporter substrate-binding protein [Candidatus Doudnabacteria bacterium]|nr:peptide ABC transporter substrate-binding protein [Candidatus Doudnabacteria bacterium]
MNSFAHNLISYTRTAASGTKELKHLSLSRLRKVFSLLGKNEKIALAILFLLAALSFIISARNFYYRHTTPVPATGGVYSEGLLGQPTYINPLLARQEPDLSLTQLVFSGLYKYDANGQLSPDLADGMPVISDDQKQYTINLRRDVKWHNEKSFTADDVIYTIQLLQDPSYKSPLRPLWQATTVEKLSDYSVKFTTKDISGPFLENLTLPILPQTIWSKVDSQNFLLSKFNLEAIGSGPYAIKQIKKLPSGKVEEIDLQANQYYYANKPQIEQLVIKFYDSEDDILNAFHSREISGFGFIPLGSNLYLQDGQTEAQVFKIPLPQYQVVFFNLNNKILADKNVRQALSLATDKRQIIDQVFKNNALLPVSPMLFEQQQNSEELNPPADVAKANELLSAAGWNVDQQSNLRLNKKGAVLELTIATNDSLVNSKAAELLANQWRALNIKVNLTILPSKQLTDTLIKPRTFDILLFPQKFGSDPDPFLFWHSSQTKDPGVNLTGFQDSAADKLITEARTTTNKELREQNYAKFRDIVSAAFPVIYLDQTEYIYALDQKVKNVGIKILYEPYQRFYDINNWYIEQKRVWK